MSFLQNRINRFLNIPKTSKAADRRSRLGVEQLEDRLVPTVTLTSAIVPHNAILHTAAPQTAIKTGAVPSAFTFTASPLSSSQISLSWYSVAGASSYYIDMWVNGAWKYIGSVNSAGCTVNNLSQNTLYYFDVGANNASGTTWANWTDAKTYVALSINHPVAGAYYYNASGSLFGSGGPSYRDVEQGAVGDCWLLASLAEVAAREPQAIRSMFTFVGYAKESDGVAAVYNVRFFDNNGVARYVTVDTELPNSGGMYDHPANGVLWVALAEKAYAEANGYSYVTTGNVGSDSYSALNSGDPVWALRAITGKSAGDFKINPTNIVGDWNANDLVVLISKSSPSSSYIVGSPSEGTHAYAVVGYNPYSSQPFTVYNPWGSDSSGWALGTFDGHSVYGLFTCNGSFLSANFSTQSVGSEAAPAANGNSTQVVQQAAVAVASTPATPQSKGEQALTHAFASTTTNAIDQSLTALEARAFNPSSVDTMWAEFVDAESVDLTAV
jgi:hypothetical protein